MKKLLLFLSIVLGLAMGCKKETSEPEPIDKCPEIVDVKYDYAHIYGRNFDGYLISFSDDTRVWMYEETFNQIKDKENLKVGTVVCDRAVINLNSRFK